MDQQIQSPDLIIADVHDYTGFRADVFSKGPPYCGVDYGTVVAELRALSSKLDAERPGRRTRFVHRLEGAGMMLAAGVLLPFVGILALGFVFGIPLLILDRLHIVSEKAVMAWLNQTAIGQWTTSLVHYLFKETFNGWLIMLVGNIVGWSMFWLGRNLSYARAETVLADDPRRPILLLHAFDDDAIILYEDWSQSRKSDSSSLEDAITAPARALGPVIAIGRPGESIRYRGAARQYHSELEWKEAVLAWMDQALLIVVIAGRTDGLAWELREIDNRGLLHKIIVFFPPKRDGHHHQRWSRLWQSLPSASRGAINQARFVVDIVALHFRPSGGLVVLRSRRRAKLAHYRAALNLAMYGCLCRDWKEGISHSGVYRHIRDSVPAIGAPAALPSAVPRDADEFIVRGNTYLNNGEQDRAIADYTKAIELNPKYALAYYNRGNAWLSKGEQDRAIADYTKAIELNPKYADAYHNRAVAWRTKGDQDRAIADCAKAIELNPNWPEAHCLRGNAWLSKGEQDRAIADYTKAIELNPKYADAYYNRGLVFQEKGRREESVADFRSALSIDPIHSRSMDGLGSWGVQP